MRSYKAKRMSVCADVRWVCMCKRMLCVYAGKWSVSVKTNAAVSKPKKRMTGVRYGLRADKLCGGLRTSGAHKVR